MELVPRLANARRQRPGPRNRRLASMPAREARSRSAERRSYVARLRCREHVSQTIAIQVHETVRGSVIDHAAIMSAAIRNHDGLVPPEVVGSYALGQAGSQSGVVPVKPRMVSERHLID